MGYKSIGIEDLKINPITLFSKEWPLLTAGNSEAYNTMTIAWGHIGAIWNGLGIPTMNVYVRPQRHTKKFMDSNELFTVSVLPPQHKESLAYLGKVSGRDEDKVAKVGLTPMFEQNFTYFGEAKMVFVCRKIYQSDIKESGFLDKCIVDKTYPNRDFHTMYVGEIVSVLSRDTKTLL